MLLKVCKRMGFGRAGLYFWDELPGRYRYWARSSGPWAVRVAKKSARAISTQVKSTSLLLPPTTSNKHACKKIKVTKYIGLATRMLRKDLSGLRVERSPLLSPKKYVTQRRSAIFHVCVRL